MAIDDLRIQRVVTNLLGNALKFAPRHTHVVVRLEACVDGGARISVIDAGPGMAAAETAYVFERYRRTKSASHFEGSGLGLFVAKQIVEAHGGMIGVDSVPGTGSRFYFELPAM
jgi:signal transduction histidine kinase